MDNKQKTAEYFKNKSEEEIINWMLSNLSTDQIKACLGNEIPDVIEEIPKGKIDIQTLRSYCANKPYIIHKIEDDKVYFWYFLFKSKKWAYYSRPIDSFPKEMGANAEECDPESVFEEDQREKIYQKENTLQFAMKVQKQLKVDNKILLSSVFTYTPVLIESADSKQNIYYYYLWYEIIDGMLNVSVRGKEDNINSDVKQTTIEECADDFNLILEHWIKLNEKIIPDGKAGSSDNYSPSQIQELIKKAVNDKQNYINKGIKIFEEDFDRIIYNYKGLNELSTIYFMKDLFPEQSSFGETKNYNTLEEYVKNYYGKSFSKLFKPNIVENKFGLKTIHYSLR